MTLERRIAFIGGGNMAEALIRGMLSADVTQSDRMAVADVSSARLTYLQRKYNVAVTPRNVEAVREADVVLLCVKPQVIDAVLAEITPVADASKLVISIAAGVSIERIEKALVGNPRVIRVMPNTPALVLAGAAGVAGGKRATEGDLALAQDIFGAVGRVVVVEEKLMDAVTGLSGSGPAYVFTFIEALADAGVKVGIPRALAMELAVQTVLGSARMVLETKEHPAKLRDMVISPGGTTIAGMHELEKGRLRASVMSAVEAAAKRSRELGGKTAVSPQGTRGKKAVKKVSRKTAKSTKKKKQ
jgi:pyrroline-5-carboxylate reductase